MSDPAGCVRQMLLYTLWADRVCLKALEQVSAEDLVRDTGTSFGSLLGTLAHILGAERRWLARVEGKALDRALYNEDQPDFETLSVAWIEASAELGFFIASLTAEQVSADITWIDSSGNPHTRPLWQPVVHLVNHSTYHRGQVVSLLRQLGYAPPSTDLIDFLLDQAAPAPASAPPPAG
jgi:uncharacterized damage-inducible protein DinB